MRNRYQTDFNTRQYMIHKDFEIYYYKDNNLSKIAPHSHTYYEFYFFLEGDVSIIIDGTAYKVKERDIILIPPGVPHYAIVHNQKIPYRRFVFWVSQEYCNQLSASCADYAYIFQQACIMKKYIFHNDVIAFNTIQSKVYRLIEELNGDRFGKKVQVSLCAHDLILHLNRIVYEGSNKRTVGEEENLYRNLTSYIDQHLDEDLSLDKLAEVFYVSKYYIAHLFKESIGISIHQYITKRRLALCKDAIITGGNIVSACELCGFKDYSSFYRAFKKEFGISPKEYKQLHQTIDA